jgi:hypothetical protein
MSAVPQWRTCHRRALPVKLAKLSILCILNRPIELLQYEWGERGSLEILCTANGCWIRVKSDMQGIHVLLQLTKRLRS